MSTPIIIPIKTTSIRCPNKNYILLPFTLDYLVEIGRIKDAIIVTDSDLFKTITDKYPIKEYYIENDKKGCDEFSSIQNYLSNKDIDWFIWLPVTQPCRSLDLLDNIESMKQYDVVTSYVIRQNRYLYAINDHGFIIHDTERKGSLCPEERICDGAIYYLTKRVLNIITNNPKFTNYLFWNGNIGFIENKALLIDIDTEQDLNNFLDIIKKNPTH